MCENPLDCCYLDRLSALGHQDDFSGKVIRIHGQPYRFLRRLGRGGFGKIQFRICSYLKKKKCLFRRCLLSSCTERCQRGRESRRLRSNA